MSPNPHPVPLQSMPAFGPLASHAAPYLKLSLPAKFYNVPADAPALFSTKNGTQVKRQLSSPPPAPVVRSDFDEEVKRMAAHLRQELPQVAGLIRNPTSWKDLYYFFDSVDLWVEGAVFLYFVISHICKDNLITQEAQHRMQQSAKIFQYAGNWVAENSDRVAKLPSETDFLTLFGPVHRADIRGFGVHELEAMTEAIRYHHARLREKYSTSTRTQGIDAPGKTAGHPAAGIQKSMAPRAPHVQPAASAPIPVMGKADQYNHNVGAVPSPASTQASSSSQAIQVQRMRSNAVPASPSTLVTSHSDTNGQQHQARSHGYSGDGGHGGRPQTVVYPDQGVPKPPADQSVPSNSFHGSPPGTNSKVGKPVYVHNSQRVSPPRFQGTRAYSDPHNGHSGPPNDAILWNDSYQGSGRQSQTSHERFNKNGFQYNNSHQRSLSTPFKGHPDAKVTAKSSTFYYKKGSMDQKNEFVNQRTLYIHGAPVEMFSSHALRDMMSEVGTVESISYLYSNRHIGPAFVTFAEESAVQSGIARFNGLSMPSGRPLEVRIPDRNPKFTRERSDSQSSQIYTNHTPTYPGRHNPRTLRKNSVSSRQYNRSYQAGDGLQYPNGSPEACKNRTLPYNPQPHALKSQAPGPLPYPMSISVDHLHSSMSEIRHQIPLGRLAVTQMALEAVDHYSGGNIKSTGLLYDNFGCSRKENSPIKSVSKNNTPDSSPKKEGQQRISPPHTPEGMSDTHQPIDLVETLRASARQKRIILPVNVIAPNNESRGSMRPFMASTSLSDINNISVIHSATEPEPQPTMVIPERPTRTSISTTATESVLGGQRSDGAFKSKKAQKNKKKQASLRREVSDSTKSTATTTASSVDTTSPTLTDATSYKSTTTSFSEVSSRNHSFASAKSVVSLPTTSDSSVDESLPSTPTPAIKHSKVGSSGSPSSFLTPKAANPNIKHESKSFKNQRPAPYVHDHACITADKSLSNDKVSSSGTAKLETPDSVASVTSLENHDEWPALERSHGTPSRVVGCKSRNASGHATAGHNATAISKKSNAVIPALPLNMIPQRRNSNDIAESKAWPRVRRCVGK